MEIDAMRSPCAAVLDTARDLLDHGILPEGSRGLAHLRDCANTCGCGDWQECREQTAGAWRSLNPDAVPRREAPAAAGRSLRGL